VRKPGDTEQKGVVLIVDDNPTNLGLLFEYLTRIGYEVLLSQEGEDALEKAKLKQPDIILLDVMMAGLDGFETCRNLKATEITKDIPVIFVTALSDPVDKIRGFEVGGVDYITKPFQPEEVGARVSTHLTIRRLQQQLQAQNALLEEQKEELAQLNASKDKFFSIIAHDLRSPLTALLAYTRFAAESFKSFSQDELQEMVDNLRDTSENLYELLENLLDWSRIQGGMMGFYPQQVDIHEVLRRNVALFEPNAKQKQITLKSLIQETMFAYVDEKMVDAIFRNLISNALKFTPTNGHVEVAVTQNEKVLKVSISDTGIGIPQEDLPKLFRIDEKYRDSGTAGEMGTGLGLILCQELVEKSGGKIWVESKIGKGSTFTFTLPRKSTQG
jgi:two-component system sensor histidine kinase/response regulator